MSHFSYLLLNTFLFSYLPSIVRFLLRSVNISIPTSFHSISFFQCILSVRKQEILAFLNCQLTENKGKTIRKKIVETKNPECCIENRFILFAYSIMVCAYKKKSIIPCIFRNKINYITDNLFNSVSLYSNNSQQVFQDIFARNNSQQQTFFFF